MKSIRPIFNNDMFMHQPKADLDAKTLFRKITHQLDTEFRNILVKCMIGNDESIFHSSP